MENFQKSKDGRWYYGGYITIDPEEYEVLKSFAKSWKVPDRIAAGILLRDCLRRTMDFMDYVNMYHKRMREKDNSIIDKEKKGDQNGEGGS